MSTSTTCIQTVSTTKHQKAAARANKCAPFVFMCMCSGKWICISVCAKMCVFMCVRVCEFMWVHVLEWFISCLIGFGRADWAQAQRQGVFMVCVCLRESIYSSAPICVPSSCSEEIAAFSTTTQSTYTDTLHNHRYTHTHIHAHKIDRNTQHMWLNHSVSPVKCSAM